MTDRFGPRTRGDEVQTVLWSQDGIFVGTSFILSLASLGCLVLWLKCSFRLYGFPWWVSWVLLSGFIFTIWSEIGPIWIGVHEDRPCFIICFKGLSLDRPW